jgi:hypothetical protein
MPIPEGIAKGQRSIPMMDEILAEKGAKIMGSLKVYVKELTRFGLEDGWEQKVDAFADEVMSKAR